MATSIDTPQIQASSMSILRQRCKLDSHLSKRALLIPHEQDKQQDNKREHAVNSQGCTVWTCAAI